MKEETLRISPCSWTLLGLTLCCVLLVLALFPLLLHVAGRTAEWFRGLLPQLDPFWKGVPWQS